MHVEGDGPGVACRAVGVLEAGEVVAGWRAGVRGAPASDKTDVGVDLRKRLGVEVVPREAEAPAGDGDPPDLRTAAVEWDEHGLRHKPWRTAVADSTEEDLCGTGLDDGQTCLHLCRLFVENGGNPRQWG